MSSFMIADIMKDVKGSDSRNQSENTICPQPLDYRIHAYKDKPNKTVIKELYTDKGTSVDSRAAPQEKGIFPSRHKQQSATEKTKREREETMTSAGEDEYSTTCSSGRSTPSGEILLLCKENIQYLVE